VAIKKAGGDKFLIRLTRKEKNLQKKTNEQEKRKPRGEGGL